MHPPQSIHAGGLMMAAMLVVLAAPGCIVAGNVGTLNSETFQTPAGPATVEYERQSMVLGTAFDFRVLRLVSALDMQILNPTSSRGELDPQSDDQDYTERSMYRLDVPVLSLWDFDRSGLTYPGMARHRHSIEVWGRAGVARNSSGYDPFYGGALTYYRANAFAVAITADYWTLPAEVRVFQNENGALNTLQGQATGWVIGFEVTLFAGEHALDIATSILEVERRTRGRHDRLRPSGL
ncbi:MAG: hypothetical protein AAFX99_11525 [Myxococcota bacterium]